jgi:hypothetical protein
MTSAWWCAAGALTIISAALFRREIVMLIAANPAARLPWTKMPANTPRSVRRLGIFASQASGLAVVCVFQALGQHPDDILWGLPLLLTVLVTVAPQVRHNRRVRGAA